MRISARGEYGVKVMAFLASQKGQPMNLKALSQECHIPLPFLARIMLDLKRAQLTKSIRGKSGGYLLARDPKEIQVKEVLEALGGKFSVVECLQENPRCLNLEECRIRPFWANLKFSLEKMLEISLEDLLLTQKEVFNK